MSTSQQIKTNSQPANQTQKPSSLDRFSLGFEYNKTLQEIRREVRMRTI